MNTTHSETMGPDIFSISTQLKPKIMNFYKTDPELGPKNLKIAIFFDRSKARPSNF